MSRSHPAVRREMWRVVRERQNRPSHLMDYGDWPPAPIKESLKPEAERIDWPAIRRRAMEIVIMWLIVADLGLILLAVRGEQPLQMNFPSTSVTGTLPPHPATTGERTP